MSVRQGNVIIAGGNSVTVDQALDINSPNAIANSAVTAGLNGKEPTITLTASRAVITDANGKVAASTVTSTELGYVSGVTSAIQTQLNGKEPTITLTASRAVISDANGKIDVSSTTSTELGYVHGVTSDIQTQINAKADDSAVVHLADAETISGVKTFSASPKVPTAGITSDDTTAASTAFVRDIMPAGVIVPFAGTTVPAGYLLCDGSAVSRTTYADLFAAIGTTYGAGDGNTTFNLPTFGERSPWFDGTPSNAGAKGDGVLPNITGHDRLGWSGRYAGLLTNLTDRSGCFVAPSTITSPPLFFAFPGAEQVSGSHPCGISFIASNSNPIYGGNHVVPRYQKIGMWAIKY